MNRNRIFIEDTKVKPSPIGTGSRICVMMTKGRLWTTLFYPPTLTRFRLTNIEFSLSFREDLGPVGRTTLGIIARAEKVYKRGGLQYSRKAVEQIRRAA